MPVVKNRKTYVPVSVSSEIRTGACVMSTAIVPALGSCAAIVTADAVTVEVSMLAAPAGRTNVTSTKLRSFSVPRFSTPPGCGFDRFAVSWRTVKPSVFAAFAIPFEVNEPAAKVTVTAPGAKAPLT